MMLLNNEQIEKIELLDVLFNSLTVEQLKELAESEKVISILKGKNDKTKILSKFMVDHDMLKLDHDVLRSTVDVMKSDLHVLIRLVLKPNDYNSHSDAIALKSKYNIY